ncbi:MAG TPA: hypothetical protein VE086_02935 [Chthoniobacterales bacterium]|nr:hypothetical protein [Chthoniobacterales bacterium]
MKVRFLLTLLFSAGLGIHFAEARSINDVPAAKEALLRIVSPKFYRSLLISPIEGWIVVRGALMNDHLTGTKIIRSELGGTYDRLALDLANNLQIVDYTRDDMSGAPRAVFVHLLIYKIADGTLAMSFAHFDDVGGNQLRYSGAAWMAALKGDKWVTIEPRQLTPHERRGPRMYTLAVEAANSARSLQGNGRPSIAMMSVKGRPVSVTHSTRVR